MPSKLNIDLTELQLIMDDLPDAQPGQEHRQHALTKDDIMIIARVVQAVSHRACTMGLQPEEVKKFKAFIRTLNGGILAIGYAILAAIGAGLMSALWWAIKHGIIEVAQKGGK